MKIACISDIHGNKLALDAVLDDAKNEGVKRYFVLGDLAMGGYDPNYTIEKIFSLKNAEIIQGNTDKLIVDYSEELFNVVHSNFEIMANALKLDDVEITKDNKQKLANLPINAKVDINGTLFELCHGSPRKQDENVYPNLEAAVVEEMAAGSDAEIILCGHTHLPCGYSLESSKTVINVGSVGRSMTEDKMPVYLLITANSDGSFSFEHRRVLYDNKKVSEIIKKRNFEKSEEFSKLYV